MNDHLRIQSGLQCNTQIFNVLRNNFVFCIDDVTSFIDISIDKYSDFFNADDIKNFILKLQINDNQIKQKLKIVSILFDKCSEKMKPLIEEIFPKIEELSSTESLNDEISELINQVLEQAFNGDVGCCYSKKVDQNQVFHLHLNIFFYNQM